MVMTAEMKAQRANEVANDIAAMDLGAVKEELLHFEGAFRLDFSDDFLGSLPEKRLRHILLAARLQQNKDNQ